MTRGKLVSECGAVTVDPCLRTTNVYDRMRGLLYRPEPSAGSGLLIDPCSSVHTFGMSYPIDVVFLDENLRVLRCIDSVAPWRMLACRGARMTLELRAGDANVLGVNVDQEFLWHA